MEPKVTLFKREKSGITYRIPALIYINDSQTFLAFAEKRTSPYDHDATLLVMRRGTRQNGSIQVMLVQTLIVKLFTFIWQRCHRYDLFLFFFSGHLFRSLARLLCLDIALWTHVQSMRKNLRLSFYSLSVCWVILQSITRFALVRTRLGCVMSLARTVGRIGAAQ